MSEKKELTAWHGALTATVAIAAGLALATALGLFKQDPAKVEAAKVERQRIAELDAPLEIGRAGAQASLPIQRFADKEAGNWCYVLDGYRSISCVPVNNATYLRWQEERKAK